MSSASPSSDKSDASTSPEASSADDSSKWKNPKKWIGRDPERKERKARKARNTLKKERTDRSDVDSGIGTETEDEQTTARPTTAGDATDEISGRTWRKGWRKPDASASEGQNDTARSDASVRSRTSRGDALDTGWDDTVNGTALEPQDTALYSEPSHRGVSRSTGVTTPDWSAPNTTPPTYVPNYVNDYGTRIDIIEEDNRSEVRLDIGAGETNFTADIGGVVIKFQRHGPMLQPAGTQALQNAQTAIQSAPEVTAPSAPTRATRPVRAARDPIPAERPQRPPESTAAAPPPSVQTATPTHQTAPPQSTSPSPSNASDTEPETDLESEPEPEPRSTRTKQERSEPESRPKRSRLTKKRPTISPSESDLDASDSESPAPRRKKKKSSKSRRGQTSDTESQRPRSRKEGRGDTSKWDWLNNWKDDTDLSERDYRDKKLFVRQLANRAVADRYDTTTPEGRKAAQTLAELATDHSMTILPADVDTTTFAYGVNADLDENASQLGLKIKDDTVDLYGALRNYATARDPKNFRNLWTTAEKNETLGDFITRTARTDEERSRMINDHATISQSLDEQTGRVGTPHDLSTAAFSVMQAPNSESAWQEAATDIFDKATARNTRNNTNGHNPNKRRSRR